MFHTFVNVIQISIAVCRYLAMHICAHSDVSLPLYFLGLLRCLVCFVQGGLIAHNAVMLGAVSQIIMNLQCTAPDVKHPWPSHGSVRRKGKKASRRVVPDE